MAFDKHWHEEHFTCEMCKQLLKNGEHYDVEGSAYCLACHWVKRLEIQTRRNQL